MDQTEIKRLHSGSMRVLDRLRQGVATNVELCTKEIGGLRAGGRIFDLRKAGYSIETRHVQGGVWEFELKAEPKAA